MSGKQINNHKGFMLSIGLKQKIVLTITGVILLLGLMIAVFVNINQTNALSSVLQNEGVTITRNLAINAVEPILTDDLVGIQRLINEVRKLEENVFYIYIIDVDGYVLVHTFNKGVPASLAEINVLEQGGNYSAKLLNTEYGYIRDIAVPVDSLGVIHVGISENNIRRQVFNTTWTLILMTFVVMIFGVLLASYIAAWELRPLDHLTKGADEIARGNLEYRIEVNTKDEIGILAEEFNKMAQDLNTSRAELIKWNEELEKRVIERTKELATSDEKISAIADSALDGIHVIDKDGIVKYWNKASEKLFGYTKQEAIGKKIHALIAPERFLDIWQGAIQSKAVEVIVVKKDGTEFPAELSLSKLGIQGGWDSVGMIRDITERKKAEEERKNLWQQFLHSQKMDSIGRLTGKIAHDFNNLLTSIVGFSYLALELLPVDSPATANVKRVCSVGEKATRLIDQLLSFSRTRVLEMEVTNLNNIINEIRDILEQMTGEDVKIELKTESDIKNIKIDPAQIEQVLFNLAINARQAMPEGGWLTISISNVEFGEQIINAYPGTKPGTYVKLSVQDTGVGIPEEVQGKIFEPFFTTKEKGEGTGLGLSTVFGIVKQHNGYINVRSELNKGTAFNIYFPATGEELAENIHDKPTPKAPGTETVLVVEDDSATRKLFTDILKLNGYNALEADCSEDALIIFEREGAAIDLLLVDVVMSEMNGWELYETIKKKAPDIKVIFTSGYVDNPIIHNVILKNDLPFIKKPFTPDLLISELRDVLDKNK